jgi:hypothetical protein
VPPVGLHMSGANFLGEAVWCPLPDNPGVLDHGNPIRVRRREAVVLGREGDPPDRAKVIGPLHARDDPDFDRVHTQ